jgi:RNA ligase (TIGR02306 family)
MAEFEVKVRKVDSIQDHPNADRLTVVHIGEYRCISNKKEDGSWRYKVGDAVVYIPESAVVPEWLLKRLGFWDDEKGKGVLAGSKGNRVKAIRLRDIFSEGILMPVESWLDDDKLEEDEWIIKEIPLFDYIDGVATGSPIAGSDFDLVLDIGDDVATPLGILKYVPEIPTSMGGEVFSIYGKTLKYDIESVINYPDVLIPNEPVFYTEKIHGTFCAFSIFRNFTDENLFGESKNVAIWSKGLGSKGLVFKNNVDNNTKNVYCRMFNDLIARNLMFREFSTHMLSSPMFTQGIHIVGELFGRGIQDLDYKMVTGLGFRVFDIYLMDNEKFLSFENMLDFSGSLGLDTVPIIAEGPYNFEDAKIHAGGSETVSGFSNHMREGVVIKPRVERIDPLFGRVAMKYVSEDYKLRKGKTTEFN